MKNEHRKLENYFENYMEKNFVESMRKHFEFFAKMEYGDSAVAVVSEGKPGEYDNNPTIAKYQELGYKLADANMFGDLGETGEILIFQKAKE